MWGPAPAPLARPRGEGEVNANTGGVACQRCGEGGEGGVAVSSGQRPAALIAECEVRIETEILLVVNPSVKGIVEGAKNAAIGLEGVKDAKTPILVLRISVLLCRRGDSE
jgi:hypothetical protein